MSQQPGLPQIDVNEYGGKRGDSRQAMNRRLFMQLVVFEADEDLTGRAAQVARERRVPSVIYADASNPRGVGLLTWSEDPAHFVSAVRPMFHAPELRGARLRQEFAMLGRTYSTGYEPDLEHWLLRRPVENVMAEGQDWHVWYPLRRTGAFAKVEQQEQNLIMREHAQIGMAYGHQELAHDVRLACHGLDQADNEFVIGLVGKELHPLSHIVQAMRKTRQTSEFIEKMGPFFVGHVEHRISV